MADRVIPSPAELKEAYPVTSEHAAVINSTRESIAAVCRQEDRRLLVVVGPCSIHDEKAAIEYAGWLAARQREYADQLLMVMRCYVEKPRTRLGWAGFAHDPDLDGKSGYADGIARSRKLMHTLIGSGVPLSTEFVEPVTAMYLGDLMAWTALGARTVESPAHRRMASGLSCPVGFKNGTSGAIQGAVDAMITARAKHIEIGIDEDGRIATHTTAGSSLTHLILRGGNIGSNADSAHITLACDVLRSHGLTDVVMIDCGHGNANGSPAGIVATGRGIAEHIASGLGGVMGVMIESNLMAGRQEFCHGRCPDPSCSITDPCLGLADTEAIFNELAEARLRSKAAVKINT